MAGPHALFNAEKYLPLGLKRRTAELNCGGIRWQAHQIPADRPALGAELPTWWQEKVPYGDHANIYCSSARFKLRLQLSTA